MKCSTCGNPLVNSKCDICERVRGMLLLFIGDGKDVIACYVPQGANETEALDILDSFLTKGE